MTNLFAKRDRTLAEIDAQIASVRAEQALIQQGMNAAIDVLAETWGDPVDGAAATEHSRLSARLAASHKVLARLQNERLAEAEKQVVAEYLKVIAAVEKAEAERAELEKPGGAWQVAFNRYRTLEQQRIDQRRTVAALKSHANLDAAKELMDAAGIERLSDTAADQISAARAKLYSLPTLLGQE